VTQTTESGSKRSAGWLPEQEALESWLEAHSARVAARGERLVLHPVIEEFQGLIDTDLSVRMYLNQMIEQVPSSRSYADRHLERVEHMLQLINELLTMAPEFDESSMVGTPLNAVLDWPMGTPAGFGAFRDPRINAMLKKVLGVWCEFLSSEESLYVLNDSRRPAGSAPRRGVRSAWTSMSTTPRTSAGAFPRETTSSLAVS
jgi:phosphatidylserine decarboxylase